MPFPIVQRIVTDFERAIFVAVRKNFANCSHFGCNFLRCQAIIKKIRDLKPSTAYNKKGPNPIRDFVFRLICLAYLPDKSQISLKSAENYIYYKYFTCFFSWDDCFGFLLFEDWGTARAGRTPGIHESQLDSRQILDSSANWSCFNILSRTKNDCEGLHDEWNKVFFFYNFLRNIYLIFGFEVGRRT